MLLLQILKRETLEFERSQQLFFINKPRGSHRVVFIMHFKIANGLKLNFEESMLNPPPKSFITDKSVSIMKKYILICLSR